METGIEIQNISKRYSTRIAVDGLSLNIREGEIFGFVGPNGAGKTTTIRMLCGLLKPDLGEVYIGGISVQRHPREIKRLIGYIPDEFGVYPDLLTWEYLDFFAACYGQNPIERAGQIDNLLELVDLQHRKFDQVDKLSRGMKQRLSLARVLMHDPQFLILDEPASGLDPRARIEIRELLLELAAMGKSVFFSSHILADVAEICDRVGIIEAGKLVSAGRLEEMQLQLHQSRKINLILLGDLSPGNQPLFDIKGVSTIEEVPIKENKDGRKHYRFSFTGNDMALSEILSTLINNNIPVLHFSEEKSDLEEIFLRATKGQVT